MDITKLKHWLHRMQVLCYDQTGHFMSITDIQGHLDSEEFRHQFGVIPLDVLINLLIEY